MAIKDLTLYDSTQYMHIAMIGIRYLQEHYELGSVMLEYLF